MLKRQYFFLTIVIFLFFAAVFYEHYTPWNSNKNGHWSMKVNKSGYSNVLTNAPFPESFGVGLYESPEYGHGGTNSKVFKVNGTFEKYLFVANAINKSNEYLIFALVDYKQVPFYVDGKLNLTHLIKLKPMEYRFLKIKVENLSEGYHDLFVGVFLDPYNHNLSDMYRLSTDFSRMGGVRIQVISNRPIYKLPNFTHPPISCGKDDMDGILVTKSPCEYKAWLRENFSENIKYYINIGNKHENLRTFALVAMLNYRQIPITNDTLVYYGYVYKNQDVAIPAELKMHESSGEVQEFVVIHFPNPFLPLQFPPDVRNINLIIEPEPSIRIAILPDG